MSTALPPRNGPVRLPIEESLNPLNLPEDGGHAHIKLVAHGTLRANLYLYAGGELIAEATGPSRSHAIRFSICGGRHARVRVSRRSGHASYNLQANIP